MMHQSIQNLDNHAWIRSDEPPDKHVAKLALGSGPQCSGKGGGGCFGLPFATAVLAAGFFEEAAG